MDPQEIGLLVLPVILLLAVLINYFDKRLELGGEQRNTASHEDNSTLR